MKANKKKLITVRIIDLILSIAPLLVPIIACSDYYTVSAGRTVSLSIGVIILIAIIVMICLGKFPKGVGAIVWLAVVDVALFLIGDIVTQMKWLILATIVGQLLSMVITRPIIRKRKKQMDDEKTASVLVEKLKEQGVICSV